MFQLIPTWNHNQMIIQKPKTPKQHSVAHKNFIQEQKNKMKTSNEQ
jgi:hypothetical protein